MRGYAAHARGELILPYLVVAPEPAGFAAGLFTEGAAGLSVLPAAEAACGGTLDCALYASTMDFGHVGGGVGPQHRAGLAADV